MRRNLLTPAVLCLALLPLALPAAAQFAGVPTKLPFQGRLATPSGNPVPDATYSVTFRIFHSATGGTAVWSQTLGTVSSKNGTFAVALDFGSGYATGQTLETVFGGTPYLEIQIGADTPLVPRQPLFSVPYAFRAQTAAGVLPGTITQNSLANGLLNFSNLGGSLALTQIPDGLITAPKLAPNVLNLLGWGLFGNSGIDPATNFIGTTDAAPLILKANNARALRLEYAQSGTSIGINLIGGYNGNSVDSGIVGATIAGGGGIANNVTYRNQIQANFGTIGGGINNTVTAIAGTIPGGFGNQVTALYSLAAGTYAHAAHAGSFVWADGNTPANAPFASTLINTFLIKAANGVGINKNNPAAGTALDVNGKAVFTKVGIGVSNSADALAVSGDASVTGNNTVGGNLGVTGQSLFKGNTAFGTVVTPDPNTPITVQANVSNNVMLFTNSAGTNYRWRFNLLADGSNDSFSLYESGASSRITVRSGGNVGIGTTTPTSLLHVAGTSNLAGNATIGGNASLGGTLTVTGNTTLNGALGVSGITSIGALVTGGQATVGGGLSVAGASTLTGATRLLANSSVGANLPPDTTAPLAIQASPTNDLMVFSNSSGANYRWRFKLNTDGTSDAFTLFESGASNRITVRPGGNVGIGTNAPSEKLQVAGNVLANNVSVPSDVRFKHHIVTYPNALETLLNLRGVTYEYNRAAFPAMNFNGGRQVGFIAQEVEKILPELVHTDSNGYKSVTYTNVVPVLVEAVKAQQRQIDLLKAGQKSAEATTKQLSALESENRELKALLLDMAQRMQRLESETRR